ncbi:hypothetical protein VB713_11545 [Anabaena cylindrica UHCC 0172]|uniref:hypothetical protein n=1 Tax=Anabaena cylindrica TaxID=1165 RepID=UPI002B1FD0E0|nr:hypothetical protein [Anabaena cylindrica]MEA5551605.1 hypothetical protein [Anabaena cylindrica UHCC 0172]
MDRKNKRLLFLVVSCSISGVILGGTLAWAESKMCLSADTISSECLTQNLVEKTIQGMSTGLLAGAGAAGGAAWNLRHQD